MFAQPRISVKYFECNEVLIFKESKQDDHKQRSCLLFDEGL